jgi:hypothetical protein
VEGDQTGHHPQESQLSALAAKYEAKLQLTIAPDSRQLLQQLQSRANKPELAPDQLQAAAAAAREAVEEQLKGDQKVSEDVLNAWKVQQQQVEKQVQQQQPQQQQWQEQQVETPVEQQHSQQQQLQQQGGTDPRFHEQAGGTDGAAANPFPLGNAGGAKGITSSISSKSISNSSTSSRSSRAGSPLPSLDALRDKLNQGGAAAAAAAVTAGAVGWVQGLLSGSTNTTGSTDVPTTTTTSSSTSSSRDGYRRSTGNANGGGSGDSSEGGMTGGLRSSRGDQGAEDVTAGGGIADGVKGMVGMLAAGVELDRGNPSVKEVAFDLPDEGLRR